MNSQAIAKLIPLALLLLGTQASWCHPSYQCGSAPSMATSDDPSEKLRGYLKSGDVRNFTELARKSVTGHKDDAKILDEVAWIIVSPPYVGDDKRPMLGYDNTLPHPVEFQKKELLNLALEAVKSAVEMTNKSNAAYLDTLGWAYYRLGRYHEACDAELEAANNQPEDANRTTKYVYFYYAGWFCR